LLEYCEWRNFLSVVGKSKTACEVSGFEILDHFVEVNKMVDLGSGSPRQVDDLMLTRYACYLIAQNGDSKKQAIGFCPIVFRRTNAESGDHREATSGIRTSIRTEEAKRNRKGIVSSDFRANRRKQELRHDSKQR